MSLDELRAQHPHLGFAVYAIDPRGAVTFEVHDGTEVYTFKALTEAEAIDRAFPPKPTAPAADVFD